MLRINIILVDIIALVFVLLKATASFGRLVYGGL